MAHVRDWMPLSDAVAALIERGHAQIAARSELCSLLADKRLRFIAEGALEPGAALSPLRADAISLAMVMVPLDLRMDAIDWDGSRPLNKWRAHKCAPSGLPVNSASEVQIDRLLVHMPDILEAFETMVVAPASSQRKRPARGPKSGKLNEVKQAMRLDLAAGTMTRETLKKETEKALSGRYGVSRDTARKARDAILDSTVEIVSKLSRKLAANDK